MLIKSRLQKIDIVRGIALIGMVIYHFSWDMTYFSYLPAETPSHGGLKILARIVAFSFLFLCGFSLFLSHQTGIKWSSFWRRLWIIIAAAVLVSLATYFIMPEGFIYFGILHQIALTSIVGLVFLRLPLVLNVVLAAGILVLSFYYQSDIFNHPALWWLGLSTLPRPSFDYVPFFPWFYAGLLGISTARFLQKHDLMQYLAKGIAPVWLNKSLQWMGRHSLLIYLIHQPILLGIVYAVSLFVPPSTSVVRQPMEDACIAQCVTQTGAIYCKNFCGCLFDQLEEKKTLLPFAQGKIPQTDDRIQTPIAACWKRMTMQE